MVTTKNEQLVFQELTDEEKKRRGILGRLYGPCADVINATRNGRKYSEKLWEKVFKDPIVLEMIERGGIPGEFDHPVDRQEICSEKIAIMMPELPKKNEKGQLVAYFDILDTPNGNIAYTLAKYGFQLGISSRGTGDVYEDYNGEETVDPDTYTFNCFDLVLCPSVKTARLKLQESLNRDKLNEALTKVIESATPSDREIMLESLKQLKIDYKTKVSLTESVNTNVIVPDSSNTEQTTVDDGAYFVEELQRQLKANKDLTESLAEAKEKLSVCYAKEARYEATIEQLHSESAKVNELEAKIESLSEALREKDASLDRARRRVTALNESVTKVRDNQSETQRIISQKDEEISVLKEALEQERSTHAMKVSELNESIQEVQKNTAIKSNEYSVKMKQAQALVEKYKLVAEQAKEHYITAKARMLGASVSSIKSKLSEGYTFDDVDRICESLQTYQLNMSKLPFTPGSSVPTEGIKMKVTESVESIRPRNRFDDEVDASLLRLAGLED